MDFDLARYADLWTDPDEHVIVQIPHDADGTTGHLITSRWSRAGTILELEPAQHQLVIDRMIAAGVEVISLSESRRRERIPQWTPGDPQHIVAARPRDAHHVRLSDGRFQRVFRGPDRQLFCGDQHILAAPELTEVISLVAGPGVSLRPVVIFDPSGANLTAYSEILPTYELTPHAIHRAQLPPTEIWHYKHQHLFVSPRLRAEIESRGIPELSLFHGFSAIFQSTEFLC